MDDRLRERIEKIKALAERGVGGEKDTAQKKLDKLLKDNGLTIESLESEEIHYYLFSYSSSYSKKLLFQVMYKVLSTKVSYYRTKHTRNKVGVYCTHSQKIEIELDYEFYLNLFEEEVDSLLSAFIQEQDLFPNDAGSVQVDISTLTPEEKERMLKQQAYQQNINKRTRSTMIEQKDN